jgi:hypothetical protein
MNKIIPNVLRLIILTVSNCLRYLIGVKLICFIIVANGDVIVTLLPLNTQCSWLTPATFKPELVPEELMAQCLSVCFDP